MKNYISISFAWALQIVVLLILAWTETGSLQAQTVWNADNLPIPHYRDKTQWVSNPDQVVSPQETDSINALINRLHQSHDVELLVVAVKRLENGDCYETGMALARKHGIGDKKKNNGLIILLSTEDRSYYILTGHGLEGVLPDIICNRIETHYMVPLFKEGKWGEGLFAGVKAISRYLEGDAEHHSVVIHKLSVAFGASSDECAYLGGGSDEGAGLVFDHADIIGDFHILAFLELHVDVLAFVDADGHCVKCVEHRAEHRVGHHGDGRRGEREHGVAGEDVGVDVPFGVDRLAAAAHVAVVHHVIVKEREVMKHLDAGGGVEGVGGVASEGLGGHQHQGGAQTFAAAVQGIFDW